MSGRRRCSSRLPGAREHNATSFMVMQAALAVLLSKLAPVLRWRSGFRSRGGVTRCWMSWWGFSSTPWCCGWIWRQSQHRGVLGQVRARSLAPTSTRMCRLSCWWSGSTRLGAWPSPLVQVMLAWQNSIPELGLGEVQASPVPVDTRTARMDLAFSIEERWTEHGQPAGFAGWWSFAPMCLMRQHSDVDRALAAGGGGDDRRPEAGVVLG
ncbi:hxxPF-repeated domain protein [Mycobacterium xenopi 4042]|uniref:HxxPF-repeated domain protein n=1 Tax=Mycobacterium xenopi 4042 TaxID=1299334 RepID=X7YZD1_MYCXE|nr:hxxPF-repeated domain protein [Mycobacterium xenopi 4042]